MSNREGLFRLLSGTGARPRLVPLLADRSTGVWFVDCREATELCLQTAVQAIELCTDPVVVFGLRRMDDALFSDCARARLIGKNAACNFESEIGRTVLLVGAGTADNALCEYIIDVLGCFGLRCVFIADCGVCGLHRSLSALCEVDHDIVAAIVVAGMEGALSRLVCELIAAPVIVLPSLAGYGVSAGGVAAFVSAVSSSLIGGILCTPDDVIGACSIAIRISGVAERRDV